jgi:hypothetical protein
MLGNLPVNFKKSPIHMPIKLHPAINGFRNEASCFTGVSPDYFWKERKYIEEKIEITVWSDFPTLRVLIPVSI